MLAYDEDKLKLPAQGSQAIAALNYESAAHAIKTLKSDLAARNEATALFFGNEREQGFQSILGSIEQTFGGESLYKTIEERAAHLLYFIIKDHPFMMAINALAALFFAVFNYKIQRLSSMTTGWLRLHC